MLHDILSLFGLTLLGISVILPLANPLTTVALFLGLSGNMSQAERNGQVRKTAIYVAIIMIVTFYAGQLVMRLFGISIPGLRIAGGLIVSIIGFKMLFPSEIPQESTEAELKSVDMAQRRRQKNDIAFVPLAMPSTAGPGTMAMIITSTSAVTRDDSIAAWVYLVAPLLISVLMGVIVWACLKGSTYIMRFFGNSGIDAMTRLMGFLLICMAVQFAITGVLEIVNTFGIYQIK